MYPTANGNADEIADFRVHALGFGTTVSKSIIVGVDLFDEQHILVDFSDGQTHKFSAEQLRTLTPIHSEFYGESTPK